MLGVRRREPSVSFIESFEAGSNGKDDLTVLEIAAGDGRILVSHDARTMPGYFRTFIARQESPGLILVPQRAALGRVIDDLVLLWRLPTITNGSIRSAIYRFKSHEVHLGTMRFNA